MPKCDVVFLFSSERWHNNVQKNTYQPIEEEGSENNNNGDDNDVDDEKKESIQIIYIPRYITYNLHLWLFVCKSLKITMSEYS